MKILNIFAHFDDAEIWAGGTLLKHSHRGDDIITLVNDSEESIKNKESLKSHLLFNGRLITNDDLTKEKIENIISEIEPDIIITHRQDDSNPEHKRIFELVMESITAPWISKGVPKRLLTVDSYSSRGLNGIFSPSVYVDISDVWDNKVNFIKCFESEPTDMWINMIRIQNEFWGEGVMKKYCEVFKEIPIQGKLTANDYL